MPDSYQGGGRIASPSLVRTEEQLAACVEHLSRHRLIALDVETDGLSVTTNNVHWVGLAVLDRTYLIPMGHPTGELLVPGHTEKRVPPEEERKILPSGKVSLAKKEYRVPPVYDDPGPQLTQDVVFDALRPVLFSGREKVGHNLKFDIKSLRKYYPDDGFIPGPYHDTMILAHILDENLPSYGLKGLVMDWLRVSKSKDVRARFYPELAKKGGILDAPIDAVAQYLSKDVWHVLQLYRFLDERLTKDGRLGQAYGLEMAVYPVLMEMEYAGIRIDSDHLHRRGEELLGEIRATQARAWSICGEAFPMTKTERKRHYLFAKKKDGGQGLKPLSYTEKTNTPQLNQELLTHYAPTNELAALFLEWSEKDKLYSTFVKGLEASAIDGVVHTSFNQHRTVTGRLSSSDPNLQQIPGGDAIRSAFVPREGRVLIVSDYDQVELRAAAYLSGDPVMIDVFQKGHDIHAESAASMYGVANDEVTKEMRSVGKVQNFLTLYGGGAGKLAKAAGCDKDRAEEFIARYYERFFQLGIWKAKEVLKAKRWPGKHGGVPTAFIPPFGRLRRLPDLASEDFWLNSRAERQVVNSVVQGFSAYILKLALIDLKQSLGDIPGAQLLLNVHDEVVVEVPEENADMCLTWVKSTMEEVTYDGNPIIGDVPLQAEAKIAKNWAQGK